MTKTDTVFEKYGDMLKFIHVDGYDESRTITEEQKQAARTFADVLATKVNDRLASEGYESIDRPHKIEIHAYDRGETARYPGQIEFSVWRDNDQVASFSDEHILAYGASHPNLLVDTIYDKYTTVYDKYTDKVNMYGVSSLDFDEGAFWVDDLDDLTSEDVIQM